MLQCQGDSFLLCTFGDVVAVVLQHLVGVLHRDADAGIGQHVPVVLSVPKGHRLFSWDLVVVEHGRNALRLSAVFGYDVDPIGVPASDLAGGELLG